MKTGSAFLPVIRFWIYQTRLFLTTRFGIVCVRSEPNGVRIRVRVRVTVRVKVRVILFLFWTVCRLGAAIICI